MVQKFSFTPADFGAELAALIEQLGTERFEKELFQFVARRSPAAVLFAIELKDGASGHVLVTESDDAAVTKRARILSRDYADTDFAGDEVYTDHHEPEPGQVNLVVQRPEDRDEEFRRKYFDRMDTVEEVSIFDRSDNRTLYIGLCSTTTAFEESQLDELRSIAPLITSLLRKHGSFVGTAGENSHDFRERRLDAVRRALVRHESRLTTRESDVCARIVVGYSARAIADILGISYNTVATHRKQAYAKLGISSQTELFGIFYGVNA